MTQTYTAENGKTYVGSENSLRELFSSNFYGITDFTRYLEQAILEYNEEETIEMISCPALALTGYPVGTTIQRNLPTIEKMTEMVNYLRDPSKPVCLVCTGSSGAIIAGIMSLKLTNVTINHIKKDGETSHSNKMGSIPSDSEIWMVDDFISTGSTIIRMADVLQRDFNLIVSGAVDKNNLESLKNKRLKRIVCKIFNK